jgi:4-hydroxythreonine-4-phosphate dehydrogenase
MKKPVVAIAIGDPNGIGPEVTLKALSEDSLRDSCRPVLVSPVSLLQPEFLMTSALRLTEIAVIGNSNPSENEIEVLGFELPEGFQRQPGKVAAGAGEVAARSLAIAVQLVLQKAADALVTAPLSKKSLNLAGYHYPGQTEFLAEKTGTGEVVMVLLSADFRVGLATTHCPLVKVASLLSRKNILNKLKILDEDLRSRFRISNPRIAVSALNPHAGEQGLFGSEEIEIIRPAIEMANDSGIDATGPYPADTLFARVDERKFDAYLAMYHDQGLIPLKLKSFGRAVNYTAGLPIIRTSPDHGTAFDIAGKGVADPGSMMEAITLAVNLAEHSHAR